MLLSLARSIPALLAKASKLAEIYVGTRKLDLVENILFHEYQERTVFRQDGPNQIDQLRDLKTLLVIQKQHMPLLTYTV